MLRKHVRNFPNKTNFNWLNFLDFSYLVAKTYLTLKNLLKVILKNEKKSIHLLNHVIGIDYRFDLFASRFDSIDFVFKF